MEQFELQPYGTNQKSFYHKANVERVNSATRTDYNLYSYNTLVAKASYNIDNERGEVTCAALFIYNLQSAITIKHVKAFMYFMNRSHGINFFKDGNTDSRPTLKYLRAIRDKTLELSNH